MAYFKSDLFIDVQISATFAVWVDFGFVAGFLTFLLKIRNCDCFKMWLSLDM